MRVRELLTPQHTYVDVHGVSKKRLLDQVAQFAADTCPELTEQLVFDALIARERLGSTGIGEGIAIPHCRMAACDKPIGMLLKLDEAIDFESIDGKLVDLVFVLLVPEANPEQHLKTLSHLAALFNESGFREQLRTATTSENLYQRASSSEEELRLAS
ncbi:MAG: PTS IIA-like nitrogen regulatory protein PtsN [Alcanivoracaceae bacterium]|nr:PTS IIA-like nitrogen regulatory protein PtsN [Alcanivoracaceae bacterium]